MFEELKTFFLGRRQALKAKYNRVLPFGDYISDRWEKAEFLGFGPGTSVYDSAHIFGDVTVGEESWIGPFTILDGSGGLKIGSHCSISAGVQIYSHDTVKWATSGGEAPYEYAPTAIEDNCYIGPQSVISMGVTIGKGAVIGAGSVVLSDVPAGARFAGAPARDIHAKKAKR